MSKRILKAIFLRIAPFAIGMSALALMSGVVAGEARAQAATVDPRLGCDGADTAPPPDLSEPDNIDFFKRRLLYYRCTAYDKDIADVIDRARTWIASRAPQVERPAIVLDIDETSLLNWPRIYTDGYAYFPTLPGGGCDIVRVGDPCGDLDWQKKGFAKAIGPTLELYRSARCIEQPQPCNAITVFFVTGRREKEYNGELPSAWTLRNLEAAGYIGVTRDRLMMRDPNNTGSASNHKIPARASIESQGFRIIANIGDQKSDLAGGHSEMTFKLPNPFYFIE